MNYQWPSVVVAILMFWTAGCAHLAQRPAPFKVDSQVTSVGYQSPDLPHPSEPMATAEMIAVPTELIGPQPLNAYILRAMVENRTVQAAYHNVESLKHRIPQVTALDDPTVSNSIFPIPSVAPQYSLMGYNPYNLTLAQQFPWCGTLQVRGQVAARDVDVALAEMAAAQLDAVMAVKRAYYDLYANPEDRGDPGREPQDPGTVPRKGGAATRGGRKPARPAPGGRTDQ